MMAQRLVSGSATTYCTAKAHLYGIASHWLNFAHESYSSAFQRNGWIATAGRDTYFAIPSFSTFFHEQTPLTWYEGYKSCPQRSSVRLIQGEAAECGLRDGYVVPISTIDGAIVSLSFGGPGTLPVSADLSVLNFAASYALGRHLHRIATWRRVNSNLTAREWDCLLWAGEGKTNWEISAILGISKSTVTKHIMAARAKLGAVSKAHAIAMAIRTKLLR